MKSLVLKNISLYFIANIFIKSFWVLIIDAMIQNKLGAADFGSYQTVFNISLLLSAIIDLGLSNVTNNEIARDTDKAIGKLPAYQRYRIFWSLVYVILTLGISVLLGLDYSQLKLLIPLMGAQVAISWIFFYRGIFGGLHLFTLDRWFSILDRLIVIFLLGLLLLMGLNYGGPFTSFHYAMIQAVGTLITGIAAYLVYKNWLAKNSLQPVSEAINFRAIFLAGLPWFLIYLIGVCTTRADLIMLEKLADNGAYKAGIYSAAFRIYEAMNQLALISGVVLFPVFSRLHNDKKNSAHILQNMLMITIIGVCIVIPLLWYGKELIISTLYTHPHNVQPQLLGLLLLCFIPSSISYIFGAFLLAQRQLNYLIAVGLIVLLLNLLGNYVLIPSMDVFSLAYIAIGTNTLLCVLYGVYSLHRLEQLSSPHIWKGLLYVFLALGVMWSIDLNFHNNLMAVLIYGVIWILVTLIFWRKSILKLINE